MSTPAEPPRSCETWMDALSALVDGEDPGVSADELDVHVRACPDCAAFQDALDGQAFRGTVATADDRSGARAAAHQVAAAQAAADRASRPWWLRAALVVFAVQIAVLAIDPLVFGESGGAEAVSGAHDARHLGAFSVAYAVGLLAVAWRPARARAMVPVAVVLVAALVISAGFDVIDGEISAMDELIHVPDVLSLCALWALADPSSVLGRVTTR